MKKIKIILACLILITLVVGGVAFSIYSSIKLDFNDDKTTLMYGEAVDVSTLYIPIDQEVILPVIDTTIIGETEYVFKVVGELFDKEFKHTVIVVDNVAPVVELKNNVIITSDKDIDPLENIISATDNSEEEVEITINGAIDDEAGIYDITYLVEDNYGNVTEDVVTYLYNCTPENMKEPFTIDGVIIASKTIPLPKNYDPGIDETAEKQLYKMLDDMDDANVGVAIKSTYRDYDLQEYLFNRYAASDGIEEANRYSAKPGYSEHQTGLAFDVGWLTESFENSDSFEWLDDNAHKYGFILRYHKGKEEVTGYIYEPWHYRYLGVELATKVKESGLTLEEYYKISY